MNVYVGNLNYRIKDADLRKAFEAFGEVVSVKLINDHETHRFKGIAFVEMSDEEAALRAMKELNGTEFFGRRMIVSEARRKTDK